MQVKQTPETPRFLGQLAFSLEEAALHHLSELVAGWFLAGALPCHGAAGAQEQEQSQVGLWQPSAFCLAQSCDTHVLFSLKVRHSEVSLSSGQGSGPGS